jgi:4'-phosphopantetheinyl transferase
MKVQYKIIYPEDYSDESIDAMLSELPEWRKEEAMRFKLRQGRTECILAYWLLSNMLGYKPEFVIGEHGKPELSDNLNKAWFNLSHCKEAVACVVSSEGEVGIDVECLGRYKPSLAEYCMSDEELQCIAEAEDADAEFTLLWTKKEALLKLTGEGIINDMKGCLTSLRADGVVIECGINRERGYAWSVAYKE